MHSSSSLSTHATHRARPVASHATQQPHPAPRPTSSLLPARLLLFPFLNPTSTLAPPSISAAKCLQEGHFRCFEAFDGATEPSHELRGISSRFRQQFGDAAAACWRANRAAAAEAAAEQVQQACESGRHRCSSSSSSSRRRAVEGVPAEGGRAARRVCHWSANASMCAYHDVYVSLYRVMVACGVDDRECLKRNTLDSSTRTIFDSSVHTVRCAPITGLGASRTRAS